MRLQVLGLAYIHLHLRPSGGIDLALLSLHEFCPKLSGFALPQMRYKASFKQLFSSLRPLRPIPASNLLTLGFTLDVRCDAEFCRMPEGVHSMSEVLGELGRADLSGLCHH